jgi:outer membrane protein
MKNISLILNAVLFVAVGVLFVLHFSGNSSGEKNNNKSGKIDSLSVSVDGDIAYINVDSLLREYKYYDFLEKQLLEKQKNLEADLNRKMTMFEKEANEFQRKVQNNSFLSQESAQRQQEDLMEKQQNLYKLKEDLSNELMKASAEMEKQLLDTVTNFLKDFNSDGKYRYILNSAGFLYGNEGLNVTDTVAALLNLRYEAAGKNPE